VLENLSVEFEQQLFCERLDGRAAGPGLRDDNLFTVRADVKARERGGGVAELIAQCFECASQAASGNSAGDHALQSFQSDQIGEGEEALAPAGLGGDEAEAGPIVELTPGDAEHPHYFIASESLPHLVILHRFCFTQASLRRAPE